MTTHRTINFSLTLSSNAFLLGLKAAMARPMT
jgi:hypothetical protein